MHYGWSNKITRHSRQADCCFSRYFRNSLVMAVVAAVSIFLVNRDGYHHPNQFVFELKVCCFQNDLIRRNNILQILVSSPGVSVNRSASNKSYPDTLIETLTQITPHAVCSTSNNRCVASIIQQDSWRCGLTVSINRYCQW